jgi:methionine-rich copper-binding protein CopC
MPTRRMIIAFCGLVLVCLRPHPSGSHAFPEHAEPRVGATVAVPPDAMRLWFDGALEPAFSRIRVQIAGGERVDQGDGHVALRTPGYSK